MEQLDPLFELDFLAFVNMRCDAMTYEQAVEAAKQEIAEFNDEESNETKRMTTSVDAVVQCPFCLRDLPESWKGRCFLCEDRAKEQKIMA